MKAKPHFLWPVIPILLIVLVACSASAAEPTDLNIRQTTLMEPGQKTTEVSTEELQTILSEQSATVFDARSSKEYSISHIPGAYFRSKCSGEGPTTPTKATSPKQGDLGRRREFLLDQSQQQIGA